MCCLFGLIDYHHALGKRQKNHILRVLAEECELRGTDATGIAYNANHRLRIYKRPLAAHKLHLSVPACAGVIMGHTRMTTQGSEAYNFNNHPFYGRANGLDFALAHNGVLYNDHALRKAQRLPGTRIQTDSYIAVQLIEQKNTLDFSSLKYMAEQVEGSFSFTVLDARDRLYFIKGDNPLCIVRFPRLGLILYASTEMILGRAVERLGLTKEPQTELPISCGDILRIDEKGNTKTSRFCPDKLYWNRYTTIRPYCFDFDENPENSPDSYVEELKSVCGAFGYTAEDVDALIAEGFAPEELEEVFYAGLCH